MAAQTTRDRHTKHLSNLSNTSFNGTSLKPETHEAASAASAASAAIKAARLSTSSSPVASQNARMEGPTLGPYQTPTQPQQQPMVQQQESQQPPPSPVSDAGSHISIISESRSIQVIARAQAMFDFAGEDEGDLPFKVGDIINVIEYLNADWWRGILRKNIGIFPTAYVQLLKPPTNG
ncbi:hypothetical protein BX616_008647, partial [Lobosporangium transversale]